MKRIDFLDWSLWRISMERCLENQRAFEQSLKRSPATFEQNLTEQDRAFLKGLNIEEKPCAE